MFVRVVAKLARRLSARVASTLDSSSVIERHLESVEFNLLLHCIAKLPFDYRCDQLHQTLRRIACSLRGAQLDPRESESRQPKQLMRPSPKARSIQSPGPDFWAPEMSCVKAGARERVASPTGAQLAGAPSECLCFVGTSDQIARVAQQCASLAKLSRAQGEPSDVQKQVQLLAIRALISSRATFPVVCRACWPTQVPSAVDATSKRNGVCVRVVLCCGRSIGAAHFL